MKLYRKSFLQPMRPYIPGEDMTGVSVSNEDVLEVGGMIAWNPARPKDIWYVAKQFFEDNYEEVRDEVQEQSDSPVWTKEEIDEATAAAERLSKLLQWGVDDGHQ